LTFCADKAPSSAMTSFHVFFQTISIFKLFSTTLTIILPHL
jgi:hypothetical protein